VERENAFFKSSPVDEYHLPQMISEKVFWVHHTWQSLEFESTLQLIPRFIIPQIFHPH
jgi:hypothetical protein